MLEFWLKGLDDTEELRLPVPPSTFNLQTGNNNSTINIQDVGEVNLPGKRQLSTIELSTFFPSQKYAFCDYLDFPEPYACVDILEKWKNSGKPIHLIITSTNIDMYFLIESFTYGERDGTGDVYFTLSLKEYRFLKLETTEKTSQADAVKVSYVTNNPRPIEKQPPKVHIVKQGETLWGISKSNYGDGNKWVELANLNGIVDPHLLQPGQELIL